MDKKTVIKGTLKAVTGIGISAIVGGLGGVAMATYTGVARTIARYTIPVANYFISKVIKKQTDPVVEETVDDAAKMIGIADDAATVAKAVVES